MSIAEWTDPGFAVRLGQLLRTTREARGQAHEALVDQCSLTREDLEALERGTFPLDDELISEVAALYGADLGALVEPRRALEIDIVGWISMGSARARFDPLDDTSLLTAYLTLVRQVRRQQREPVIALRRSDIEVLASFLCLPGERVLEQLATLMGVTQRRRQGMLKMFASGAAVIGLATTSTSASLGASAEPVPTSAVSAEMRPLTSLKDPEVDPQAVDDEPSLDVELAPPAPAEWANLPVDVPTPPLVDVPEPPLPQVDTSAITPAPIPAPPLPPPNLVEIAVAEPAPPPEDDQSGPVIEPTPEPLVAVGLPPVPPIVDPLTQEPAP